MTRYDDELAQMRDDLTTVANELTDVKAQVAAGDSSAADRLQPLADQLHNMASGISGAPTSAPADQGTQSAPPLETGLSQSDA